MIPEPSTIHTDLPMRSPDTVMKLSRMGSFHQSRLSFMRVLLRRLKREGWKFDRPVFDLDEKGVGVATYRAIGPERSYTLVAFAHDLPDEKRSDRVIADAWDATFALHDGEPTPQDIERLSKNVPLQEAGRVSEKEFSLSRANKSVRLFNTILEALAKGEQPEAGEIDKVGYLMRTTAVYGSGKFGAADRSVWADRPEFSCSFQPELLSVWLTRTFAIDWLEHQAKIQGGEKAVTLARHLKRRLGIGNSTGLGMAPYLVNHPKLIHAWVNARETALGRVRNLKTASAEEITHFRGLFERACINADEWHSVHPLQVEKIDTLKQDLEKTAQILEQDILQKDFPWNTLFEWSVNNLGLEGQEQLVSLMLEPYPQLVDDLADTMCADETSLSPINGQMPASELRDLTNAHYGWASTIDFNSNHACARAWYTSEEKLEPRLGERHEEDVEAYELPLSPARDAMRMLTDLKGHEADKPIADFLLQHPEHRHIVRRIQMLADAPYGEIRDNTIDADILPIDMLRCKLSFFGATKFDPRSDRWVRITMYQHAPYPDELEACDPDDCFYPKEHNS